MTWLVGNRPIRSALVTRLRYLGDVAMSTVVCEALKAGDPDLRLGYLCEQAHGTVLFDQPHLDRVHLLGVDRRGSDAGARGHEQKSSTTVRAQGTWGMIRELRQERYDVAVDLFFNPRSAWLLKLSGIPVRIGGTKKWRQRLYTHTVLRDDIRQDAPQFDAVAPGGLGEHLCRLAPLTHAESGLDFLTWLAQEYRAGELKPRLGTVSGNATPIEVTAGDTYWVLAPGATWAAKEWPSAHWRELASELTSELTSELAEGPAPRLKILLPPGQEIRWRDTFAGLDEERVAVLPSMSVPEVKELLAASAGLISVDGGVMHIGVALGVPTLGLFGPTDPNIWFPYEEMGPFEVLALKPDCHPCDLHECGAFICLPDLKPASVRDSAVALFGQAAARTGKD